MEEPLKKKILILLEKISQPTYILNSYYAENLLNKFMNPEPDLLKIIKSSVLSDIILKKFNALDTMTTSVQVFILRLLAIVSQHELQFSKIFNLNSFLLLDKLTKLNNENVPSNIRVALVELATALTSHSCGIAWLLQTQVWKHIVDLSYEKQSVFVLRAVYKFVSCLVWQLNDSEDEENLLIILDYTLKPLLETPYHKMQDFNSGISMNEEVISTAKMEPTLNMLMMIFSDTKKLSKPCILLKLMTMNFNLDFCLFAILSVTRREDFMLQLSKIIFLVVVSKFFQKTVDNEGSLSCEDYLCFHPFFNVIHVLAKRGLMNQLLDFCISSNIIWSDIWSDRPPPTVSRDGLEYEVQSQMIFVPLVPILAWISRDNKKCETIQEYIIKLCQISCEQTMRAAYTVRDWLSENNKITGETTLQVLRKLFNLKNHLNNCQASIIFQALFYLMKSLVSLDGIDQEHQMLRKELDGEQMQILALATDCILMLLKGHNIKWSESVEILCLYNMMVAALQLPNLTCKFVVQALGLINLTIMRFLPPNLTLLIESKNGSAINEIGRLIYAKLHDPNWEIRDSALELLYVCTEIAFIKYTPFQRLILESNSMSVATALAINDSEFYVQSSALKCLGVASKINCLWEHVLQNHPNIYMQVLSILKTSQEGVARKEAAILLSDLYLTQKLRPDFEKQLYEAMTLTSVHDLHWEVQLATLKFWKNVINKQLADQGMLDGKFPSVTFSKENRKIVSLTPEEIQRRLFKTLDKLSEIGCLTALSNYLNEDFDSDVMESAMHIVEYYVQCLREYKVLDSINMEQECPALESKDIKTSTPDTVMPKVEDECMEPECDNTTQSASIIQGILDSNDISLLAKIYERQMKVEQEETTAESVGDENQFILRPEDRVTPVKFLKDFLSVDCKGKIEEKKRWADSINSMSSLIDDVLGVYGGDYENDDINALDCY